MNRKFLGTTRLSERLYKRLIPINKDNPVTRAVVLAYKLYMLSLDASFRDLIVFIHQFSNLQGSSYYSN